jgi:hypothetical protein
VTRPVEISLALPRRRDIAQNPEIGCTGFGIMIASVKIQIFSVVA